MSILIKFMVIKFPMSPPEASQMSARAPELQGRWNQTVEQNVIIFGGGKMLITKNIVN